VTRQLHVPHVNLFRRMACCLPIQIMMASPVGEHMKAFSRLSATLCVVFLASGTACGKDSKPKEVAGAGQDTMLMHDLAEANRNTAAASALDNSLNTVKTTGGGATPAAGDAAQNPPSDTKVVPRPAGAGDEVLTSGPRMTPPTRASDASGPTTVPLSRSPAAASRLASRDPCESPVAVDQRSCLNRAIASDDVDLNRTYQELLAQAQKSGGADLQDRFQQSQREWINQRDTDCNAQTPSANGKLWAKARARCLADYSGKRTAELQRNLNNLRGQ
jgi:uncharacterized protein YecT (DUF1311 family)